MKPTRFLAATSVLLLAACGGDDDGGQTEIDAGDVVITPDASSDVVITNDTSGDGGSDTVASDTVSDTGDTVEPPGPWRLVVEPGPGDGRIDATFSDCLYASPLIYTSPTRGAELIVTGGDVVVGVDPATGETRWVAELPEQDGLRAFAAATPALRDGLLVVGYALRDVGETVNVLDESATGGDAGVARQSHWMAVVDLEAMAIDARFPAVELEGSVPGNQGGQVTFRPSNGFLRSEIGWWGKTDDSLGFAYATFGNVRDLQPWHGWIFELDLDAWSSGGDAISARFTTTPEENCGANGASGSFQRICGGGLWSPSGSIAIEADNDAGFDLIVAPGNGQFNLNENNYANTLLRISPGLDFANDCDPELCADLDIDEPSHACIESCSNVFVPRLMTEGDTIDMPDGRCDGLAFFECWAEADYIGGSTPLLSTAPGGERVLIYPTKDGHAYVVDADDLGTMYDREQVVNYCGTPDDPCIWSWSGMIVSEPVQTSTHDEPRILIPTFMPDNTNPAGVVAFTLVDNGSGPELERAWEFPDFSTEPALERFRRHPGRVRLAVFNGLEVAILSEPARSFEAGRTYILRASDGTLLAELPMEWSGYRFTQPAFHDGVAFVNSCESDNGRGTIETIRLIAEEVDE